MARFIITKLPPSWRGFATSLKHKRQKITVKNLIASLDVEEKAQAKDNIEKGNEGHPSANFIQRNSNGKNKGKNKPFNAKATTTFKKKKNVWIEWRASLVESLATFPRSVWIEWISKGKRRMSTS
jgi:hypothetical protein